MSCMRPPPSIFASAKNSDSPQDSASLSRRVAGLGTWRCLPQELRSSGGVMQACCLYLPQEMWRRAAGV